MKTFYKFAKPALLCCMLATLLCSCSQEYYACAPYEGHYSNFHARYHQHRQEKIRPWPRTIKI